MNTLRRSTPSRRQVAQAAWATPAVLTAAAAPAASASTPRPQPPLMPEYVMDVAGTRVLRGTFKTSEFNATGSEYVNRSSNAAFGAVPLHENWAVEQKEGHWQNLVPGKSYTFSLTAQSAPYFDCMAGTASKTLLVSSSPDGAAWTQNANIRSHQRASRPRGTTAPETTLSVPSGDYRCVYDPSQDRWGPPKTVTFSQTAGPDGKIRFRFDAWLRPRIQEQVRLTEPHPEVSVHATANAPLRWSRPEIIA